MNGRRGFLAFVGGLAIGGAAVKVEAAAAPTLILPPKLVPAATLPTELPLLGRHHSEFDAILHVRQAIDRDQYRAWLEAGLQMVEAQERARA